jgi:hypothetical protein
MKNIMEKDTSNSEDDSDEIEETEEETIITKSQS